MKCTQARPLFSSYLDGAVSGVEMHEVSKHLEQCQGCKSEYGQLEKARILLSSLGHKQAPPDLAVRIRITLASARTRTWREVLSGRMVQVQNAFDAFVLPATAGIVTAVFFFVGLIGFFVPPVSANPGDFSERCGLSAAKSCPTCKNQEPESASCDQGELRR